MFNANENKSEVLCAAECPSSQAFIEHSGEREIWDERSRLVGVKKLVVIRN